MGRNIYVATKQFTALTSNHELLADTGLSSGQSYVVNSVIFSAATATYLYFNDSAVTGTLGPIGYGYYRVPAGGTIIDRDILLQLATCSGLYATVGEASELVVEYYKTK